MCAESESRSTASLAAKAKSDGSSCTLCSCPLCAVQCAVVQLCAHHLSTSWLLARSGVPTGSDDVMIENEGCAVLALLLFLSLAEF